MSPGESSKCATTGSSRRASTFSSFVSLHSVDVFVLFRPACEVSEKMECVENTVSQCSTETRIGDTGEEEQVEVGA